MSGRRLEATECTCSWVLLCFNITVEPPNAGHVGTSYFVLCREVVLSLEIENVLVLWESEHLGP